MRVKAKRKLLRELALYALIFITAGFAGNLWMTRNQTQGLAPSLNRPALSGESIKLVASANNTGCAQCSTPTLLYFFADWCPICKLQNGVIESIASNHRVIGIAMQSGADAKVRAYVRQHGLDFPVINDRDGSLSRAYGVYGVPATFIIDVQGQIRFSTQGYATTLGLLSRFWLLDYLNP